MDRYTADIIAKLCTLAGMIMEDISPATLACPGNRSGVEEVIAQLRQAGVDIAACAKAAEVAIRRYS